MGEVRCEGEGKGKGRREEGEQKREREKKKKGKERGKMGWGREEGGIPSHDFLANPLSPQILQVPSPHRSLGVPP